MKIIVDHAQAQTQISHYWQYNRRIQTIHLMTIVWRYRVMSTRDCWQPCFLVFGVKKRWRWHGFVKCTSNCFNLTMTWHHVQYHWITLILGPLNRLSYILCLRQHDNQARPHIRNNWAMTLFRFHKIKVKQKGLAQYSL